jgi:hypothetical protein
MPPNYRANQAVYGARCAECEFYRSLSDDGAECTKYSVEVKLYMVCDSWKRNPSLPTVFH